MNRALILAALALALALLAGCANAPLVFQGTVTSYDPAAKVVAVQDGPTSLSFALTGAQVGAAPELGDVIRLAYFDQGGTLQATRVMNLTRQKEVGKTGKKGGGH